MGKIYPIFSGSKGNSTYIGTGSRGVLIDVGVSCKRLCEELVRNNIDVSTIKAIFITHEHSDHISGLKVFAKKHNLPVFCSPKTAEVLKEKFPDLNISAFENFIDIDDIKIERFSTSHDCAEGSGYSVYLPDESSCAVCTDSGVLSEDLLDCLKGKNAVLIESNHDVNMLKDGPYPPELKLRILSKLGHLSNTDCAVAISELIKNGTRRFILAHLSENNNRPSLAKSCTVSYLLDNGYKENSDYTVYIAKPSNNEIIYF